MTQLVEEPLQFSGAKMYCVAFTPTTRNERI